MTSYRELIDSAPLSRFQKQVIAICVLANMAEGYDLLSMSLAVVPLSDIWGLSGTDVGLLLSVGPIGMAIGSLALAPLSNRFGRRPLLIASLSLVALGLILSALATDVTQLAAYRLLVGIGMGGVLPTVTITVTEFAPTSRRPAVIGIASVGLPLGSALGGALAAVLMESSDWRVIFVLGAVITAAVCALVIARVPETPDHLATKGTSRAQEQLTQLLGRMGMSTDRVELRSADAASTFANVDEGVSIRSWKMVVVVLGFIFLVGTFYFGSMWLPKLLVVAGMSTNEGISGVLLLTLGSAAGGLILAAFSTRYSPFTLTIAFTLISAALLAVFASVADNLTLALVVAPILGLCQQASIVGIYAIVPVMFDPHNRATALGLGIGIGRIGAIIMPLGVGALLDMSWRPESIFLLMVVPTLIAALLVLYLYKVWPQNGSLPGTSLQQPHGTAGETRDKASGRDTTPV